MYAVQLGVKKFGRDKSLQNDLMGLLDLVDAVGQPSIIHHLGPVVPVATLTRVHRCKIVWPNLLTPALQMYCTQEKARLKEAGLGEQLKDELGAYVSRHTCCPLALRVVNDYPLVLPIWAPCT